MADCNAKKNRTTSKERVDGSGELNRYCSDTYINTVHVAVPLSLPDLTQADVDELRAQGPFTGAWDAVYPMLQEAKVRRGTICIDAMQFIQPVSYPAHAGEE